MFRGLMGRRHLPLLLALGEEMRTVGWEVLEGMVVAAAAVVVVVVVEEDREGREDKDKERWTG